MNKSHPENRIEERMQDAIERSCQAKAKRKSLLGDVSPIVPNKKIEMKKLATILRIWSYEMESWADALDKTK